jgi:hypothetical protein
MRRNRELALFEDDFEMRRQPLAPDADPTLRLQRISTLLIREGSNGALYEHVLDAAIDLMSADMGCIQVFHQERGELRLLLREDLTLNQRLTGNGFVPIPHPRVAWHYLPGVGSWCRTSRPTKPSRVRLTSTPFVG